MPSATGRGVASVHEPDDAELHGAASGRDVLAVLSSYAPTTSYFVSPDSIVPGTASGSGGGAATVGSGRHHGTMPLTVDFHVPGFVCQINQHNAARLPCPRPTDDGLHSIAYPLCSSAA